jgi:transposase
VPFVHHALILYFVTATARIDAHDLSFASLIKSVIASLFAVLAVLAGSAINSQSNDREEPARCRRSRTTPSPVSLLKAVSTPGITAHTHQLTRCTTNVESDSNSTTPQLATGSSHNRGWSSIWYNYASKVSSVLATELPPPLILHKLALLITMATPRQFCQELDQNVRRDPNMSIETRKRVIGMIISGCSATEAAHARGRSERTVRRLYQKYLQIGSIHDKPRSGRPHVLPINQKKIIYRKACAAPKIEYSELAEVGTFVNAEGTPSKPPSRSTLYRALKKRGLSNHRCKFRPKLYWGHALKRLRLCKEYRHFVWGRRTLKFTVIRRVLCPEGLWPQHRVVLSISVGKMEERDGY